MPLIGVVADDLTGATTTGVLLARSKAHTAVFFNEKAAEEAQGLDRLDAILISSNSRPLPAEEAYAKVASATRALQRMGVQYFSKRIDTTLRGGVGVEIDAMLDQVGEDAIAVVVPAMPQSRRILLAGQSKKQVGLVTLDRVLAGIDSVKAALAEQREAGCKIIIVDAIQIEDVEKIAQACIALDWKVVAVDPGPFTSKLAFYRGLIASEEANTPTQADEAGKTVLVTAGSATSVTKKQMEILCQDPRHVRISVNPNALIEGTEASQSECLAAIRKAVDLIQSDAQPRAILFETALHGDLLNLDEEDHKRNLPGGTCAERINAGLGMIVSQVLKRCGREKIAGLYTTGGDTMVNVCYQIGVQCIEVTDYVIPQTDIGRLIGSYDGLPIVGKGGLTGNDTIACDIVNRLFQESARK